MKKASILLLTGLLFGLFFAGRLAAQPARLRTLPVAEPADVWLTQRITFPPFITSMDDHSLALDAAGHPHIVYGANSTYYAWHNGVKWYHELVDAQGGGSASIALDHNGNPHIAYLKATDEQVGLWYGYRSGNRWHSIYLDQSWGHPSIALDSLGYPHIAYDGGNGRGVFYIHQNSQGWYSYPASGYAHEVTISMVLDEADHAHISYVSWSDDLNYLHWTGTQWQVEAVDSARNFSTSIALDSQGRPSIAYQGSNNVKLATRTDGGWQIVPLNNDANGLWVSLGIDANDVPHVSFYDSHQDSLMYATRPADTWLITPVDTQPDAGRHNSLVLDSQGRPHLSYLRTQPDSIELQYGLLSNNQWLIETVDEAGFHTWPALTIDASDNVHVIFRDNVSNQWYYQRQTADGWITEPIPNVNIPTHPRMSFVVDREGNPHIAYFDGSSIHYTYRANGQWSNQIVTQGGGAVSLALDHQQTPHLAYYLGELQYAYLDGTNWLTETVVSTVGSFVSMKLDSIDQPHIAYHDPDNNLLNYTYQSAGQWLTTTVDINASSATLVLDSLDRPHIGYRDTFSSLRWLNYVFWNGNGWTGGPIADATFVPDSPWNYLALDSIDHPHLVYLEGLKNPRLVHMYYNEIGLWDVHELGSSDFNYGSPSVVVNSTNHPIILYMDGYTGHLLLSTTAANFTYSPLIFKP